MSKSYRVYFNRCEDTPQVWSVDEGTTDTEINVRAVFLGNRVESGQDLSAVYPEPKAWMVVHGDLVINGGVAVIE
jgi:hypothetical protein